MDARDIIVTALSPGTAFNGQNKIFRSVDTLAKFCSLEPGEVLDLLAGDLGNDVVCKPSTKGKGILVALKANVPAEPEDPQVVAVGGPALNAPPEADAAVDVAVAADQAAQMADNLGENVIAEVEVPDANPIGFGNLHLDAVGDAEYGMAQFDEIPDDGGVHPGEEPIPDEGDG